MCADLNTTRQSPDFEQKMTLAAKDSVKTYLAAMSGNDAQHEQAADTHDADTDGHEEFR